MENWQLKQMQSLPLEIKIQKTKLRIKNWYEFYNGEVYISFSGGKDSTVLLDIARQVYPDIEAIFVDTGLEYPEIKKFVRKFDNVTTLKPDMRFDQVIKDYGYPVISKHVARQVSDVKKLGENCWAWKAFTTETGKFKTKKWKFLIDAPFKISSKCCDIMKKKPLKKIKKKPFIGTLAEESNQRKVNYLKYGCNSFETEKSTPLGFWKENDIWEYIETNNIEIAECYNLKGIDRTGCMFCLFGVHKEKESRFKIMKKTHPRHYDYCINNLGCGKVLDYLGIDY